MGELGNQSKLSFVNTRCYSWVPVVFPTYTSFIPHVHILVVITYQRLKYNGEWCTVTNLKKLKIGCYMLITLSIYLPYICQCTYTFVLFSVYSGMSFLLLLFLINNHIGTRQLKYFTLFLSDYQNSFIASTVGFSSCSQASAVISPPLRGKKNKGYGKKVKFYSKTQWFFLIL